MSTTAAPPEEPRLPTPSAASWPAFIRFWSSLKLGIAFMLAIAAASVIGTVVPQGDASVIEQLHMSDAAKHFLLAIGANNVYYSGWFLALLALFFWNLWCTTVTTVIPRLAVSLRKPPEVSVAVQEHHHEDRAQLPAQPLDDIARALKAARYRVYRAKNGGLVAHKGRFSRFSALVTHIGLFTILIGALLSGLTVYKAQVPMFPGEIVSAHQIVDHFANPRGWLAKDSYDWSVRLDRFWMDYYSEDRVKQFYSELAIVKNGQVVAKKKIWVNEPFVYDGVWFYQAFWGVGGAKVAIEGKPSQVEMQSGDPFGLKGSLSRLQSIGKGRYILYLTSERAPLVVLRYGGAGQQPTPIAQIAAGTSGMVDGVNVRYDGPALYSGLQSKADPGIPVVYTGFMILTLGTALAFFSLRQIWVGPKEEGYMLSGKANRGHQAMRQELVRLATKLGASLNEQPHGA